VSLPGYFGIVFRLIDLTLQALRAIPSIAWVPLFILWFGIFEASKVILIAVGVFSRCRGRGYVSGSQDR
jgi:sulfonate transport system permease protein